MNTPTPDDNTVHPADNEEHSPHGAAGVPGAPGAPDEAAAVARLMDAALPIRRMWTEGEPFFTQRLLLPVVVGFVVHLLVWLAGMALENAAGIDGARVLNSVIVSLIAAVVGGLVAYLFRRTSWTAALLMLVPAAVLTAFNASALVIDGPVICVSCMLQPVASPLLAAGAVCLTLLVKAPAPPAADLRALAVVAHDEGVDITDPQPLQRWVSSRTGKEIIILVAAVVLLTPFEGLLRHSSDVMWPLHSLALALAVFVCGALLWRLRPVVLWALFALAAVLEVLGTVFLKDFYFTENEFGHRYVPVTLDEMNIAWEAGILVVVALLLTTLVVLHARLRDVRVAVADHQQELVELLSTDPMGGTSAESAR